MTIEEQRRLEAATQPPTSAAGTAGSSSSPLGGEGMIGVETGELHGELGGGEGSEGSPGGAADAASPSGRHIDPFGAIKPIEKQGRSSVTGEEAAPGEITSEDGQPAAGFGLADSLLGEGILQSKVSKFQKMMAQPSVDLGALRALAWGGTPSQFRPNTWQILLGYVPINNDRRHSTLERKRREYLDCVPQYFEGSSCERTEIEQGIFRQVGRRFNAISTPFQRCFTLMNAVVTRISFTADPIGLSPDVPLDHNVSGCSRGGY